MDVAVLLPAAAAGGNHHWPAREVDAELLFEGDPHSLTLELALESAEGRAVACLFERKAPGFRDARVVMVNRVANFGPDEAGENQILERVAVQRRGAERGQVQHRHRADIEPRPDFEI